VRSVAQAEGNGGATSCKSIMLILGTACMLLYTGCCCAACAYLFMEIRRLRGTPIPACSDLWVSGAPEIIGEPVQHVALRHELPEMYGKVKEKTIWQYWYHPEHCPSSKKCYMPPVVKLCTETVAANKGSFDYKIMHADDIHKYLNRMDLPFKFWSMRPAQQKDALMNALLARYGGVALDITVILFRPLELHWSEMKARGASHSGFMYRVTGMPWSNSEVNAVWFIMSRREGIFSTAVRDQIIGMGDHRHPPPVEVGGYHNPYFALGDQTLLPILSEYNYTLPSCLDDYTVDGTVGWKSMCPEHEFQKWTDAMPGPALNDMWSILREPRDGPQLPFLFQENFGLWHVDSYEGVPDFRLPGPTCHTQLECWNMFAHRFHTRYSSSKGRGAGPAVLDFVKLFSSGGMLKTMTRAQLLGDTQTFFYNWIKLAKVSHNFDLPRS